MTSAPPSTSALPPRPATLSFTGINPCALLSEPLRTKLGLNPGEFNTVNHQPLCRWSNAPETPRVSYLARFQPTQGAEIGLDSATGHQIVSVAGFPAVQTGIGGRDPRRNCVLLIDTAPGQSLWVHFSNGFDDDPNITHEIACANVRSFSEDLVNNLRAHNN